MVRLLGIDFAPLHIPLARRLQTGTVLMFLSMFIVAPIVTIALFLGLLFTPFYWMSLGYAVWMWYDIRVNKISSRGGRPSVFVRKNPYWKYFRDYFPISLTKTVDLDTSKNYLLGYHPHGIMGCGAIGNFGSEATDFSGKFPGIKPHLLTLSANFKWPILRAFTLWMGLCDVSKESIKWILTRQGTGNAAIIVIGGAEEALEAHPERYTLTLKHRKGFVRLALQTGACLVPVFSFGENDLYVQVDNPHGSLIRKFQEQFKRFTGVSPPLFHGRGVFNYSIGLLPFRKPIDTVVGRPIDVPHVTSPTQEDIDKYHQLYMDGLEHLFDQYKVEHGISEKVKVTFV